MLNCFSLKMVIVIREYEIVNNIFKIAIQKKALCDLLWPLNSNFILLEKQMSSNVSFHKQNGSKKIYWRKIAL